VQWLLDELNDAHNELNVVVLDACRDNPFRWGRSGSGNRGLTVIAGQPANSIVVYATSAGSVAQDGVGRNGLFTSSLLNNIKTPGLEVKEIFNRTGADVVKASDSKQIPAVYSQFFGSAYFSRPVVAQTPVTPQTAPSAAIVPTQPTVTPQSQPVSTPQPAATATTQTQSTASSASTSSTAGTVTSGEDGVTRPFTSVSAFGRWLSSQPDNTVVTPYTVKLNVNSISGIADILLDAPQKYVYLDLLDSTITRIPNNSFYTVGKNCASLTGITIPKIATIIGNNAFAECASLASVTIPSSVTSIGECAFFRCASLASVAIPNSVNNIGNGAFFTCTSLISLTLPSSVKSIGERAFYSCENLASITIGSGVTSIKDSAFEECTNLTSVTFKGTIPSISFSKASVFNGDLRVKFYATNKTKGTPGTYNRASGRSTWKLQ
jgi:hypothetical protein